MALNPERKFVFFGCPLDCDEKHASIEEKLAAVKSEGVNDDPYDAVMDIIRKEVDENLWEARGSLDVPDQLRPMPPDKSKITADEFVAWTDRDICREIAAQAERFVSEKILPKIPCMIAVDHSLTGGVFKAVSTHYGKDNISLVVLDSHTDAVPTPVTAEAIQYDTETNPATVYDRNDPFLYNRPDSYNASSFIHHLLKEEAVLPQNLYIIGVSDFPEKRVLRIKDQRIMRYTGAFTGMRHKGVKIITKKDYLSGPSKLKSLLKQIKTPYIYVSIDMDIGARNAVQGVRFLDWQGLQEKQIENIVNTIIEQIEQGICLAGLDITEINPRRAGKTFDSVQDRTYRIAANLIKKFLDLRC